MAKTIIVCNTKGCEREKAREGKCLHHHIEELNEKINGMTPYSLGNEIKSLEKENELLKTAFNKVLKVKFKSDVGTAIEMADIVRPIQDLLTI